MTIYFKRKDDNSPLSGICNYTSSEKMKAKVEILYNWLLHNKATNVIIEDPNRAFFNSIYMFCLSNDLNPKSTLKITAFTHNGNNILEIEQADTDDEALILNKSIYEKLEYENTNSNNLSIRMLNTLEKAHELSRKNMQTVLRSSIFKSLKEDNIEKAMELNKELEDFFEKTI